jgi:hypothetical protein
MVGASTEEVVIPNLLMGSSPDPAIGQASKVWDFPLYVPAGSRLSAKAAGQRTSTACYVGIYLYGGDGYPPWRVGSKVTTYGITSVPNGTGVVPGASGAEGSWTQITASTSEDHFAVVPSMQLTNQTNTVSRGLALDVGIGAATEEEILAQTWWGVSATELVAGPHNSMPAFQDIPSGTRLAARMSNSGTNNAYEVALHCVS